MKPIIIKLRKYTQPKRMKSSIVHRRATFRIKSLRTKSISNQLLS